MAVPVSSYCGLECCHSNLIASTEIEADPIFKRKIRGAPSSDRHNESDSAGHMIGVDIGEVSIRPAISGGIISIAGDAKGIDAVTVEIKNAEARDQSQRANRLAAFIDNPDQSILNAVIRTLASEGNT
jgi:hypothetical protein